MHYGRAFTAGLVGAAVMSLLLAAVRAAGVPLPIEARLAELLGTHIWAVGLVAHLLIGGCFGLVYAAVFEFGLHQGGLGPGAMLGAYQTILAGFAWGLLGGPGHFWSSIGPDGVAALFLVHVAFGAVVGSLYPTEYAVVYG